MLGFPNVFDKYERNARLWPALSVISPIALAVATTFPAMGPGIAQYAVAVGMVLAGLYILMQVVRHLGRSIEESLWASWGGPPSTRFVLWNNPTFSEDWKKVVHSVVSSALSIHLLSPEDEKEDRSRAENLIRDAFAQVKSALRIEKPDGEYQTHNIEYGFARNLLGTSVLGAVLAGICAVWCAVFAWLQNDTSPLIGCFANVVLLVAFLIGKFLWLPSLTKLAANRYAEKAWTAFVELKRDK